MKTKLSFMIVLSLFFTSLIKAQSCFLNSDFNNLVGVLTKNTSDKSLDNAILNEYEFLTYKFNLKPNLYFIFDGFEPAAYVTNQISHPNYPDGTIFLGISLFQTLCAKSLPRNCPAIPLILAHNFAHLLDLKYQTGLSGKNKELFADFLTGYYLFYRAFKFQSPFERENSLAFYQKNGYTINNPQFHGTAEQRQSSLQAGFEMAYNYTIEGMELNLETLIFNAIPYIKQLNIDP